MLSCSVVVVFVFFEVNKYYLDRSHVLYTVREAGGEKEEELRDSFRTAEKRARGGGRIREAGVVPT